MTFCRSIIDATAHSAAAFKINFAFFEALGSEGWETLSAVRHAVPPDVPVIADAKRGDIGSTASSYAYSIFDLHEFDGVTLSPYLGWDALAPFMAYEGKCLFVLARTSNPGALDFQELEVHGMPFYKYVARSALQQPSRAEIGFVVGATAPQALAELRRLGEEIVLLVPGVGAQGASASSAIHRGANRRGENALISVSREILYGSSSEDYKEVAARVAAGLATETWIEPNAGNR